MRTIIHFKDGHAEIVDDAMPSFSADTNSVGCIDSGSTCLTDDVPLNLIAQVTFEND